MKVPCPTVASSILTHRDRNRKPMAEADLSALRDAVVRVGAELTGADLVGVVADEHRRQWFCRPRGWMWKEVRFSQPPCSMQDSMTCLEWRDTAQSRRVLYHLPGQPSSLHARALYTMHCASPHASPPTLFVGALGLDVCRGKLSESRVTAVPPFKSSAKSSAGPPAGESRHTETFYNDWS